ncbi:MAG TPA: DNA methyltransferase [Novosphingobium sp.]|nr:DNA methyltransferase [Novosphingobium sp.]
MGKLHGLSGYPLRREVLTACLMGGLPTAWARERLLNRWVRTMKMKIIYVCLDALINAPRNARTHTKKQLRKLARTIKDLGFRVPILIDGNGQIIAGHGRVEAAKLLGMTEVPAIVVDNLTPEQIRLLAISENRLSELGGWDFESLAAELQDLQNLDFGCDLTLSGFETAEIDLHLTQYTDEGAHEPILPAGVLSSDCPAVSRIGDIWNVGSHRLACGDAREPGVYERLLENELVQMVFADAPYNVRIGGHVSGTSIHPEFAMASGEMSSAEFILFLRTFIRLIARYSVDGAISFICMDHGHLQELRESAEGILEYKNLCVWVKPNAGMGSLYRSQHELIAVFKSGKVPHINNVELGKHGRNRTNVWRYAGANSFGKGRDAALAAHPTTKPVEMIADAILDCSERGGLILDPFLGSGTTLLAAEQTGRRGAGIEIDPHYVDLAAGRISRLAKAPIIHTGSGLTFDEIKVARAAESKGDSK